MLLSASKVSPVSFWLSLDRVSPGLQGHLCFFETMVSVQPGVPGEANSKWKLSGAIKCDSWLQDQAFYRVVWMMWGRKPHRWQSCSSCSPSPHSPLHALPRVSLGFKCLWWKVSPCDKWTPLRPSCFLCILLLIIHTKWTQKMDNSWEYFVLSSITFLFLHLSSSILCLNFLHCPFSTSTVLTTSVTLQSQITKLKLDGFCSKFLSFLQYAFVLIQFVQWTRKTGALPQFSTGHLWKTGTYRHP